MLYAKIWIKHFKGVVLMSTVNYCVQCQRIFLNEKICEFCGSNDIKELKKNAPINVIGTKLKGRVLKIKDDNATLIINTESNERVLKEYNLKELKKIL